MDPRRQLCWSRAAGLVASVWLASIWLVPATPADANMLARGTLVGGVGSAVQKNLSRLSDLLPKTVEALGSDDRAALDSIVREIERTPGQLIKDAFPVLTAGSAIARRLTAAKRKLQFLTGRAGEAVSDARAALVGGAETKGILAGERLSLPKLRILPSATAETRSAGRGASATAQASGKTAAGAWDADPPTRQGRASGDEGPRRSHSEWAGWEADHAEFEGIGVETRSGRAGGVASDTYATALADAPHETNSSARNDYEAALENLAAREVEQERLAGEQRIGQGEAEARAGADGGSKASDGSGGVLPDDYAAALAGLSDGKVGSAADDYGSALAAMEAEQERLAEEERRRREAADRQRLAEEEHRQRAAVERERLATEERGRQEYAAPSANPHDCRATDTALMQSMMEIKERAEAGGLSDQYCAAVNIAWAVTWKLEQCIADPTLSAQERRAARQQLEETKRNARQNMQGFNAISDGSAACHCWTNHCAKG